MGYPCRYWLYAILIVLAGSSRATAQEQESPASIAAEALFQQGNALLDGGFIEEACKKFQASQKLDPGVGTLLHLADCYERAGRFASSLRAFSDAAALAAANGDTERQGIAEVRWAALSPRVPQLRLAAPSGGVPEGSRIRLDGVAIESVEWADQRGLDAGLHTVEVRAPGGGTWAEEIILANDAEPVVVQLELPAPSPPVRRDAASPADLAPEEASSTARTWGYLVAAAGALSLGTAGVLSLLAVTQSREADDDCDGNVCRSPRAVDQRGKAKQLADLATVFTIAGAVTGAGGIGLIISSPAGASQLPEAGLTVTFQGRF